MRPVERERLRQASGAPGQVAIRHPATSRSSQIDTVHDLARTDQHPVAGALRPAHEVQRVVHPVGEVHVRVPDRAEHRRIARGATPKGVRTGVVTAGVRLGLGDADGDSGVRNQAAEDVVRHLRDRRVGAGTQPGTAGFESVADHSVRPSRPAAVTTNEPVPQRSWMPRAAPRRAPERCHPGSCATRVIRARSAPRAPRE